MDVDSKGFGDLLQQAEQLTADMDGNELPRVERNLRQILDAGQQLWSRTAQVMTRDSSDVKASILLGSKGYDLPKISQKLEKLSTAKTFEPIEPIRETDIEGFLKNERENAILSIIEESKKSTFERADKLFWNTLQSEWEEEKQRILNALAGSAQDIALDTVVTMGEVIDMKTRTSMTRSEIAYAREIYLYNEQIVQGGLKYSLPEKFCDIAKDLDEKPIIDLWEMVNHMTDIQVKSDKDVLASRSSGLMQSTFITQARKYLEKKYRQYIETIVYGNLQQAQLGGIPGTYFLVRAFLKIKLAVPPHGLEDGEVEGHPIWAMIYYCIRCGDTEAAEEVAESAGVALGEFLPYLKEYNRNEDRRLSPASEGQVRLMYRRSVMTSTDPFKKAVCCILGCCNVNDDHSEVAEKTDDYLWLKLCQLRPEEVGEGSVPDRMTLSQLQSSLLEEYGESHFNAYNQPFLYFQVLFLTAQFEAAIEFLSRIEHLRCHAVHVAIALYEFNLLALPSNIHAPIVSQNKADKPPMRRLNFARLIMMYTKKFEITDPREAIQYFYFLRDIRGIKEENIFVSCVSELVQETREFEMLLGKMEPDGCRKPGLIDKFHEDTNKIIEMVATDSENKGNIEDAIRVFDLAMNHEKVLELLNKLLSQVVSQPSTIGSTRQRLENTALTIAERYKAAGFMESRQVTQTFYLLLDLMTFFNYYHAKHFSEALDTIQRLNLVPLCSEEVEEKVNMFSLFAEEIRRNFPDILLATMNILLNQYKKAKSMAATTQASVLSRTVGILGEDRDQEQFIQYLRRKVQALNKFAGIIPYRMPGDTYARLVQMQAIVN